MQNIYRSMSLFNSRKLFLIIGAYFFCLMLHAQSGLIKHTVEKGETLYSITTRYKVTQAELKLNNPWLGNTVYVGQVLSIPNNQASKPVYHTIQAGETLFKLTQQYRVSAEIICEANPGLNATNFKAGTTILIPPADTTKISSSAPDPSLKTDKKGIANSDCKEMHKVKKKETVYSISRRYKITVEELLAANPEIKAPAYNLEKGSFLCIPFHQEKKVEPRIPTDEELFKKVNQPQQGIKNIRMAVLLPMKSASGEGIRTLEFYQGILMAVDSLRHQGISTEVYAFDSGETDARIAEILSNPVMTQMDIIFGPLYTRSIAAVSQFAEKNGIKLVIPFTSKSKEVYNNPSIFSVNPPDTFENAEVYNSFLQKFNAYNVIFIEDNVQDQKGFINGLKNSLKQKNIDYKTLPLNSITEENIMNVLMLSQHNIIIPTSSDIKTLNLLIPQLKAYMRKNADYKLSLFGYPAWQAYVGNLLESFYQLDTYYYTSFYRNPMKSATNQIEKRYRFWFKKDMINTYPRMALFGFDCGYYFLKGLSLYGKGFAEQPVKTLPYQNGFQFKRVNTWGGLVNTNMWFIHYTRNHQIEKIEFK